MAKTLFKYRKDVICVRLADGYKIYVSKYAKDHKMKFSDVVRLAVEKLVGAVKGTASK